jgi:hypothetical protein
MRFHKLAVAVLMAGSIAACSGDAPTAVAPDGASAARGGSPAVAARKTSVLTSIPINQGGLAGTLSITRIGYDQATGSLLFSGTVTRSSDGATESFTNVAGTLGNTAGVGTLARGNNERGVCDILFLDLGPIFLDLLGLQLDLSPIQLDLDAAPGPGNLLGNLLCVLTGLLDGGGLLTQILGVLDRINGILDLLNRL